MKLLRINHTNVELPQNVGFKTGPSPLLMFQSAVKGDATVHSSAIVKRHDGCVVGSAIHRKLGVYFTDAVHVVQEAY